MPTSHFAKLAAVGGRCQFFGFAKDLAEGGGQIVVFDGEYVGRLPRNGTAGRTAWVTIYGPFLALPGSFLFLRG